MNWDQFRAILWLRFRLSRNQLRRNGFGAAIAAAASAIVTLGAAGAAVVGLLIGALALKNATPDTMMFAWDIATFFVLFFSLIGVLTEVQRSESIDLEKLLHLPVSLKQVFIFNYLVSLVSLWTIIGAAGLLGVTLGLAFGRSAQFLIGLFVVAGFVFGYTAWIYCLRGWLLTLMVDKRRRRSIVMWIAIVSVLLGQTPNLINLTFNGNFRHRQTQNQPGQTPPPARNLNSQELAHTLAQIHPWVPLLWLPNAMRSLAKGEVLPALWGGAGLMALGWIGIRRGYWSTFKFYRAEQRTKITAQTTGLPMRPTKPVRNWVEYQVKWLPEEAAAMATAQLRSLTRAPEVRMLLFMGAFLALFAPAMIFWGRGSAMPEAAKPFIATGMILLVFFSLMQLLCNQFGYDREGFRSLVLLPTPRKWVLLGKNFSFLPLALLLTVCPLAIVAFLAKLSLLVVLATAVQIFAAFLIISLAGNLCSILMPFRTAPGSLKPSKQSWQNILGSMAATLLTPMLLSPVFVPPLLGWLANRIQWPGGLIQLLAAIVLLAVMAAVYAWLLPPLGRLLHRREKQILKAVTEVME